MKRLGFYLILFLIAFNTSFSKNYNSDPKLLVTELVNDVVNKLSDKNIDENEKIKFIEKVALENVDINALGLYTLGELRKKTDKQVLNKYQTSFEKYFLKSLTSRLKDYSSNKFKVIGAEKKSSNYTIVNSKVAEDAGNPEIKIDWRIYTKNQDKPLIRDLIVEGLSLARTQKEEFSSILNSNNNDINYLILKLEEFTNN